MASTNGTSTHPHTKRPSVGLWQPLTPTPASTTTSSSAPADSTPGPSQSPNGTTTIISPPCSKYSLGLSHNLTWSDTLSRSSPSYFASLASGQTPEILWIGCSDSRVPETTILDLQPGDVFVHRNIANLVHPSDISAAAVLEYAVEVLKVQHVVVSGHTKCGGVKAALGNQKLGVIDTWLLPLRAARMAIAEELAGLKTEEERWERLVRENVIRGVEIVKGNTNVIKAMKERGMEVHGVVFDVATGKLVELETGESEEVERRRWECFETK